MLKLLSYDDRYDDRYETFIDGTLIGTKLLSRRFHMTQTPPCRANEEPESPAVTAHRSIEVKGTDWHVSMVLIDSSHGSTA